MDVIWAKGEATAREIQDAMSDPPTDATIRTLLRVLAQKGHVIHRTEGKTYVYEPTKPVVGAARSAVRRVLDVFFGGSLEKAVSGLLDATEQPPSEEELARLEILIQQARAAVIEKP